MTSPFDLPLQRAHEAALSWIDRFDSTPVAAQASIASLRASLDLPLQDDGLDPVQVVDELIAAAEPGLTVTGGGRFHGWVIGGALPAALAADWLTSVWDQNAAALPASPSAAIVEEVAGAWLMDLLNIPQTASFTFCTGSQVGHVIALAAARHAVLDRVGWDVGVHGLYGAPPIRILTTELRHVSVDRAIRVLGFGSNSVDGIPVDEHGSVRPDALAAALAASDNPVILCLQAGELSTGVYDRFDELIDIAHRHHAWVHIDGAFGLWAAASPTYRHLMAGAEKADSWITDGHKWLNVPYDSGFCFVADPDAHRAAMAFAASYINPQTEARDPRDWNLEFSRRARGFATYAAIRQLGRTGIADLVDRFCHMARQLALGIGDLPGAELLAEPIINQGAVRFLDPRPNATDADHSAFTQKVIANILASGEALFGGVSLNGRHVMRVSVSSWQTTEADVQRTIKAVQEAINNTIASL